MRILIFALCALLVGCAPTQRRFGVVTSTGIYGSTITTADTSPHVVGTIPITGGAGHVAHVTIDWSTIVTGTPTQAAGGQVRCDVHGQQRHRHVQFFSGHESDSRLPQCERADSRIGGHGHDCGQRDRGRQL